MTWFFSQSVVSITLFFKRNATFLDQLFSVTQGHWPWPRVMYILSNGSESDLQKTPLRYSSQVSRNPYLFEYMSFWAHVKTAQIPLQSMQTWIFFQMMQFFWSRVYGIESLGIFFKFCSVPSNVLKRLPIKISNELEKSANFQRPCQGKIAWYFIFHCFPELTCTQTF